MLISVTDLALRWRLAPKTVLHVGAHEAEELSSYEAHGWGSERTVWVEGQAGLAERLEQRLADRENHRVIHAVVWDAVDTVTFHRTNESQSSSVLSLKVHSVEYPSIVVVEESRVITARLDKILADDRILDAGIDFLNLDIQGAELRALRGLGRELSRVRAIYSEVNLAELYNGCATLREIDAFLREESFVLVDIRLTNARWGDALWLPKSFVAPSSHLTRRLMVETRILGARSRSLARRVLRAGRKRIFAASLWALCRSPLRLRHALLTLLDIAAGRGFVAGVDGEVDRLLGVCQPPTTVLDVGANVGNWTATLRARSPAASIYAFEPSPAAHQRLAERFKDDPQVVTIMVALGAEDGAARLWSDESGSSSASFYQRDSRHSGRSLNRSEEVTVTTIDAWCAANAVAPEVVKVDVEGHELAVLRGAEKTLKSVRAVQFEFGGTAVDAGCYWRDYWYFFAERGFDVFRIAPGGLVQLSVYSERDESFSHQNFIAVRRMD